MSRITVDPAVQCYDPFEPGTDTVKPLDTDPRCLFGWGPPNRGCTHPFGHCCIREVRHRGRCWDGDDTGCDRCSYAQRPRNWDTEQRATCNA